MTLQDTFYIIGIIYIAVSLLLIFSVVVALLVIRKKIVSIEKMIKAKLDLLGSLPTRASKVLETVKKFTSDSKKDN